MSRGLTDEVKGVQGRSIDEGAMRGFWRHWVDAVGIADGLQVRGDRPAKFLSGRTMS
jgi:benzoate/toluate 1,2-dioxygenase alpha subunit